MTEFPLQFPPAQAFTGLPRHADPPPDLLPLSSAAAMNSFTPTFAPSNGANGHHVSQRHSQDFRAPPTNGQMPGATRNGAVPVPHNRMANGGMNMRGGFEGARSPPNNKSTSHVPCKFYRQGACQAGKACPFLHSDEPITERAPCKYFTKGNCKFGAKCALAHILPDGRVVNRQHFGAGAGGGHLNLGGRVNLPHHAEPTPGTSLLSLQAHMNPLQPPNYPYGQMQDDFFGGQQRQNPNFEIPTIDTTFSSHPGSNYGSPPNDGGLLPISPGNKVRSALDATLPASFDSQGISNARFVPLAASVPSRFGLGSSPPSSYPDKNIGDSSTLRTLHNSAFGEDHNSRNDLLGSSPPDSTNEQQYGRRIMHSERFSSKSRNTLSASLGARQPVAQFEDWDRDDASFAFNEEELLPNDLDELFTPQEKMRRLSRDHTGSESSSFPHRQSLSGLGASPANSGSKVGSPSAAASSPSRFSSLWSRNRQTEVGMDSGSTSAGVSAFGHVGSPLRNSSLHPGATPAIRTLSRPTSGDASPFLSSPPRQASMSMISQQLQRTKLSSRASEGSDGLGTGNPLHPGMGMRVTSGGSIGSSSGGRLGVDRAVSSSSIGRERIEEEQGLFSMEEEEEAERNTDKSKDEPTTGAGEKRLSRGNDPWGQTYSKSPPGLGPIGGQRTPSGNVGSLPKNNRTWNTNV